jgi:hypothetical protein
MSEHSLDRRRGRAKPPPGSARDLPDKMSSTFALSPAKPRTTMMSHVEEDLAHVPADLVAMAGQRGSPSRELP